MTSGRTPPHWSREGVVPADLPAAAHAYIAALPKGQLMAFPLVRLDTLGIPVWVVALFTDEPALRGIMPYGVGYGETDAQAVLGALGEIAEMVFPALGSRNRRRVRGSWQSLSANLGGRAVADPLTLCLPAGSPVGRETMLDWVEAVRASDGETVLVPIDVAACSRRELAGGYEPFTTLISNGLGAGPDLAWATSHGLFELLQRDGNGLVFRALDQGAVLDLGDDTPPEARKMLAAFAQAGIHILPKFASDEFGFCNLYCVGHEADFSSAPTPIMLTACGEACHPDRTAAFRKAMTELAASRARKAFAHGPEALAGRVAPASYVKRFMARSGGNAKAGETRALAAMLDWSGKSASELGEWLAPTLFRTASVKPFADLPTAPDLDAGARLALAQTRLADAGLETLYVDMSPPDRGIAVVKVIVPGLEVETMSYGRIGERNTAKLLSRDHPLICRDPVSETRQPVRLTPAALDRFGFQPLFDYALARDIVGPLYPLYREPEAHHAAAARSVGAAA